MDGIVADLRLINEAMARTHFGGRNPVGLHFGSGPGVSPDIEIVGVVKDSKHATVKEDRCAFVYIPYAPARRATRIDPMAALRSE